MKFNKNIIPALMTGVILNSSISIPTFLTFASSNINNKIAIENKNTYNNELENLKIGESVEINGLTFERVLDNLNEISPLDSTEGFEISNFGGNRSLDKKLLLTKNYGWWKIWVTNTGSTDIKVNVDGNVHSIPKNKTYTIKNNSKWKAGEYNVGFTSGAGMYGSAYSRVATTSSDL